MPGLPRLLVSFALAALAATLAGAHNCAIAQDANVFTDDGGSLPPLWRVRGEYLLWWTNGNPLPPLVTASPPGTPQNQAGVLGTPGVQTLFGGSSIDNGSRSGGRLTMTRWLEDGDSAFEFVGFYLGDDTGSGNFRAQSNGSPILGRPFQDAVTGRQDAELVAFPNVLAGQVTVNSFSEAYSAAGLARQSFITGPDSQVDLLVGYRYLRYRETLSITENLVSTNPGGFIQLGTTTDLVDRFTTRNDFHGAEFGIAAERFGSMMSVEMIAKIAFGEVISNSIIAGNTVDTVPGPPVTVTQTPGGLLALPTNIGSRTNHVFAVLPELNLNTSVYLSPRVTLIGGYSLVVLNSVLRTGNQIDTVVNTTQLGGQPLQGPAHPAFAFMSSALVMQGLNCGLDYRW